MCVHGEEAEEARAMLTECNALRGQCGLEALAWNSRLAGIAARAAEGAPPGAHVLRAPPLVLSAPFVVL